MDRAQRYHQGLSLPEHTALLLLAIIILGLDVYIIHFHADNILVYSIVLVRNETLFCMSS